MKKLIAVLVSACVALSTASFANPNDVLQTVPGAPPVAQSSPTKAIQLAYNGHTRGYVKRSCYDRCTMHHGHRYCKHRCGIHRHHRHHHHHHHHHR